mgnify:FL=1
MAVMFSRIKVLVAWLSPIFLIGTIFVTMMCSRLLPLWHPIADEIEYLGYAYTLAHEGTYAQRTAGPQADTTPGREPLYPALLAVLFKLDPRLHVLTREDIFSGAPQAVEAFAVIRYLNALLLALTALITGATIRKLSAGWAAAGIGMFYLLMNLQANKDLTHVISDYLAMTLSSILGLAFISVLKRPNVRNHALCAFVLALLCLTKTIFVLLVPIILAPYCIAAIVHKNGKLLLLMSLMALVIALVLGGWAMRNGQRYGVYALSDQRSAIVLSTREALNHMTAAEYWTSFIIWPRGFGDDLAKKYIAPVHWRRFDNEAEDGFYIQGQFTNVTQRIGQLKKSGLTQREADARLSGIVIEEILRHFPRYLATMLPVFYRGLWSDEFVIFGFPAFVYIVIVSFRRRDYVVLAGMIVPLASLMFYTAFSLNVPRYQYTAIPGFALAAGLVLQRLLDKKCGVLSTALHAVMNWQSYHKAPRFPH